MNRWVIGVMGSVIGFLLSQWIAFYQFSKNLTSTKEIEMVHLARELTKEFYSEKDGDPLYRQVRDTIDACGVVYKPNGGSFDYDHVNRYLGFFDDLGFYYRRGALDQETIRQLFGAVIVEAYVYPELQKYIVDLQKNASESSAFVNFQALGKVLASTAEESKLAQTFAVSCRNGPRSSSKSEHPGSRTSE